LRELCKAAKLQYGMKVRAGGGIRNVAQAKTIVECGATQIIVGSAAFKDGKPNARFLRALGAAISRRRIVVALDTEKGNIVIEGWRRKLNVQAEAVMDSFAPFCSAFLCTDVDREGTMRGANLKWFKKLRQATARPIVAAGGIKSQREITALQKIGVDAAVGMALYKKRVE
jgi:phosphoribosylformimino-5-aminoimidazole carboxamide ribonucleotide (ProFAR) isomerase